MRTIDVAERRARLGMRHRLAPGTKAASPVEAAASVVGLHATDPASVYLAALARVDGFDVPTMERALYDERSLLKILGMRRTMFVVPRDLAAVIQAACTEAIAVRERRRDIGMLEAAGVPDAAQWLVDAEAATIAALERRGDAVATELTKEVPALALQIPVGAGKAWQGTIGMSTRVLFLLSMTGQIIRGRPRGSWISSQYRWAPVDRWVPGGLERWDVEAARVELVRRWLAAFGPGTVADIQWWTGWALGETRKAIAGLETVEVDLDGATGLVLADDAAPATQPEPWLAFLPALDATVMGWTARDWYLGPHRAALYDTNGNAGPTIWWSGRVVGGWAQRPDGRIVSRLLEDVGADVAAAVDAEAARIEAWIGGVRITPRFRTPLEKELAAG
ncbi:MAG: winged helix DNA-binding domain-containing protein [Chloroflexota bacterium]